MVAIIDDDVDVDAIRRVVEDDRADGMVFLFIGSPNAVLPGSQSHDNSQRLLENT